MDFKTLSFATGLVLVICLFKTGTSIQCLLCTDGANVSECLDKKITCGPGEQCYLEQYTKDTAQTVFNAGCRSNAVCVIMNKANVGVPSGKRDLDRNKRSIVLCSTCCNSSADYFGPCNARLCGQKPSKRSRCLSCTMKASKDACTNRQACQDTQVCGNEIVVEAGRLIRYNFYCEEKHICHEAYKVLELKQQAGRRDTSGHCGSQSCGIPICNSCCIGDECNKQDCLFLQKNFTSADFAPSSGATTLSG